MGLALVDEADKVEGTGQELDQASEVDGNDDSGEHEIVQLGLERARAVAQRLEEGIKTVILGQEEVIRHTVTAMLAGGHVLLEGAPGLGKTALVRALSTLVGGSFSRIQFTPDLMPSDVVGTSLVINTAGGGKDMQYRPGPIFANLVLADEINRATPKTQSALLEAMAERTVSVEGKPRPVPSPFFVMATENPIEMEGVFMLPEAQLDRFLMKIVLRMPDLETLAAIGARPEEPPQPEPVTSPEELLEVQGTVRALPSAQHVDHYAARLVLATHEPSEVRYGASPRAAQSLMACARVNALLDGRVAVGIEDVQRAAKVVLRHRMVLGFEAEARGLEADHFIEQALAATPVE